MKALILLLLALPVSAGEITPEYDITTTTIIVNWYNTNEELRAAHPNEGYISGLSNCEYRPEFNISFCELWLVRPTELTEWTDTDEQEAWKTIGHELYHALAGEFHSAPFMEITIE